MTQHNDLSTRWSLRFDRSGTEEIAVICDADGDDLITSRSFWLPEGNDPVPPTLSAVRLMAAAPKLLEALQITIQAHEAAYLDAEERGEHQSAKILLSQLEEARTDSAAATGRAA